MMTARSRMSVNMDEAERAREGKVVLALGAVLWAERGIMRYLGDALRVGVYGHPDPIAGAWWSEGREDWAVVCRGIEPGWGVEPVREEERTVNGAVGEEQATDPEVAVNGSSGLLP